MKIRELLNEIATYKNADRFPRFVMVDGINDSQLIIEGESKNAVYVWGIFNQGDKWIFFETDYDRGYIFYNESFGSEEEACNYAREHFIIISNSFSTGPKLKYDIGMRYIQKEYGYSEDKAENVLNEICKYDDIFEEFSNYIRVKKLHKKDKTQVIVEGITAEKLVIEYKFSVLEAYTVLKNLRDTPQETRTYLEKCKGMLGKIDRFNCMTQEAKEVYLLVLCELVVEKISKCEGYETVAEALEKCWEWIKSKNVEADELYFYLENLDEEDIMTYMQLDKNEDNEAVWICVANTLAFIIRDAYQYEKQAYMPETIECVDDETVKSLMCNFSKAFTNGAVVDKLLEYMVMNYSAKNSKQSVCVLEIKQFVKNNMKYDVELFEGICDF